MVEVGLKVLERTLAGTVSWLSGRDIILVGQPFAGKTTFLDYLHYGLFEDEKETLRTPAVTHTSRFQVSPQRSASLELSVRSVMDTPGQIGPIAQADEVFARKPHAALVFVDATAPLTGPRSPAVWLEEFSRRLEGRWSLKGRRSNRMRCLMIVLTKADKVASEKAQKHKTKLKSIADSQLLHARGQMLDEVCVVPCCLVTNPEGTKSVDLAITHLAKSLAGDTKR